MLFFDLVFCNVNFEFNYVIFEGGSIYIDDFMLLFDGGMMIGSMVVDGGGLFVNMGVVVDFIGVYVVNNMVFVDGGGICGIVVLLMIEDLIFDGNMVDDGGVVFNFFGNVIFIFDVVNMSFMNNYVSSSVGVV